MNDPQPIPQDPARGAGARRRSRWSSLLGTALILTAGYYVGGLILRPQRRVIESAAAMLLFYIASRMTIYQSLAFFLVVYPFPTFTSVGSTNTLILTTITILWLIRMSARELTFSLRSILTPFLPVVAIGYLLSTYSMHSPEEIQGGLGVLFDVLACFFLYYMVVNFVRDEKALKRTLLFFGISSILIHLVSVYEAIFPGRAFLEGWLIGERTRFISAKYGQRTGGPFRDFELLSEYCAVTTPILLFMWLRAERRSRIFWGIILGLTVFSQFATVTRGGFISLGIGVVYLTWLLRKEIGLSRAIGSLAVAATAITVIGLFLPHVFRMESLFSRLEKTKFEHGVPDSRVGAWGPNFKRAQEHIFIGHGPKFSVGSGLEKYSWPHNGYLFIWVTIGLIGLVGYILLWVTCFVQTGKYGGPLLAGPFVPGFLTAVHVSWLVFMIDQLKIDFARNPIYFIFTWFFMGITAAGCEIVRRSNETASVLKPAAIPLPVGPPALAAPVRVRKITGA